VKKKKKSDQEAKKKQKVGQTEKKEASCKPGGI
jgi:hypothetical protein